MDKKTYRWIDAGIKPGTPATWIHKPTGVTIYGECAGPDYEIRLNGTDYSTHKAFCAALEMSPHKLTCYVEGQNFIELVDRRRLNVATAS